MSIGETLAGARRAAGLSVPDVAQLTRIRETIIRGIEADDFSGCGGDFYARGHIRSIARVVGADPEPLVREYDTAHGGAPHAMSAAEVFEPSAPVGMSGRRSPNWSVAMVLALAVIIGFGLYHILAPAGSQHSVAAQARTHAPSPPPRSPLPTASAASSPAAPRDLVIKLTAIEDCWVQLTDSAGSTLWSGIVYSGTTQTWRESRQVNMSLGNPGGIQLAVNGKTLSTGGNDRPATLSFAPGQHLPG